MSLALYRKYRPDTLKDVIGQEQVISILQSAAQKDRLAHAYLFFGPRGTGKTTTARLLAKLANCAKRGEDETFRAKGEPCNACTPCEEISAGRGLDVVEIDAASNRGIDEIRSLRESVRLSPSSYAYKIFIIDEVHQLTKDAFNALLKTLEEPPAHAIFILATTEFEKVPATITSRTQRFHFRKIPIPAIVKKLSAIVKAEKLDVTSDGLELIAASAEGSFRDAESLLDQMTALESHVTQEAVEKIIGTIGFKRTSTLAAHLLNNELDKALTFIHNINTSGYNIVDLNRELIHYLRRVLTLHFDSSLAKSFAAELTDAEIKEVTAHSALVEPNVHIPLLKSLIRAYSEMRYSPFHSIPLEVAIIEHLGDD
jgi:DNA polymerase III subunit gamma/tau